MRRGLIVLIVLMLLAGISVFSLSRSKGLPDRFPAPDFNIRDIFTSNEIRLSDYRGRPIVLYFFASW
jgi:hypothetical protein